MAPIDAAMVDWDTAIAHDLGEHVIPNFPCRDCKATLKAQRALAVEAQGTLLGYCHESGAGHAWFHKHGSIWVWPAEARSFA